MTSSFGLDSVEILELVKSTSNAMTILPSPATGDVIKIGTGPDPYHLLYRNNDKVLANVTLSANFTLTAGGFLDVTGGGGGGALDVTTTSRAVYPSIVQFKINDTTGLTVTQDPGPGGVLLDLKPEVKLETSDPGAAATVTTALSIWGDGSGGTPPYTPLIGNDLWAGIEWYSQYNGATRNQVLYRKQNLQFNIPKAPFKTSPSWDFRTYTDQYVYYNSYISGVIMGPYAGLPPVDNAVIQWDWKCHLEKDIPDDPTDTARLNEQNKISHALKNPMSAGITEIIMAKDFTVPSGDADTKFQFVPSNPNQPLQVPEGTFTLLSSGETTWQASKTQFVSQLPEECTSDNTGGLQSRGGFFCKKRARFGDFVFINGKEATSNTVLQVGSNGNYGGIFDWGASDIGDSNVLTFTIPPVAMPGALPGRRLALGSRTILIGDNDPFMEQIVVSQKDGARLDLFESVASLNGPTVGLNSYQNYSNVVIYGATQGFGTQPILKTHGVKDLIITADMNVYSNQSHSNTMITLGDNVNSSNLQTISFCQVAEERETEFKVHSNNSTYGSKVALDITTGSIKLGHQVDDTALMVLNSKPLSEIYGGSPMSSNIFNMYVQTEDGTVGTYRAASIELGEPQIIPSPVTAASGAYFTINPDETDRMGFKVKVNGTTALTISGVTGGYGRFANFGVGINGYADTTANLTDGTSFIYRIARSIVYDTDKETYGFYPGGDSPVLSTLKYFMTSTSGNFEFDYYQGYSDLATVSNVTTATIAFANVFLSNTANIPPPGTFFPQNYPWHELPAAEKYLISPFNTLADGSIHSSLSEKVIDAFGRIHTQFPGEGSFQDRLCKVIPGLLLVIKALWFQLPYQPNQGQDPTNASTQGRFYALRDCWITSVQIRFFASVLMEQGGGGGYIPLNKQFAGFYLGTGAGSFDAPGTPQENGGSYLLPREVWKYLGYWEVPSLSVNSSVSIPAVISWDLPSEDWVYVPAGDPFPYVSMVCQLTAGAGSSSTRGPGLFKVTNNNGQDEGNEVVSRIRYVEAGPVLGSKRSNSVCKWRKPGYRTME